MKALPVLLLCWIGSGVGAVGGSILGNAAGKTGLTIGAVVGGVAAAAVAPFLAVRFGWLPLGSRRAAAGGAVIGFLLAAPIAVAFLHTPLIPAAVASLAGVGALVGAGMAQGRAKPG